MPYSFKELIAAAEVPESPVSRHAVEAARTWLQDGATDGEWYDCVYEMWTNALNQIGFENVDFQFSGFSCQGDGASFVATVDLPKLANFLAADIPPCEAVAFDGDTEDYRGWLVHYIGGKRTNPKYARLAPLSDYFECAVKRTESRYAHENTCTFEGDFHDKGDCGPAPDYKYVSHQPRLRKLADDFFEDAEDLRKDLCRAIYKSLNREYDFLTSDESLVENAEVNKWAFDEDGELV